MAIWNLGVDLVKVSRIEATVSRFGQRFLDRCFATSEVKVAFQRFSLNKALAMVFAAKEAFAKATTQGFRGFSIKEIEVAHEITGKPILLLHGRARSWAERECISACHLSLSDNGEYAIAVVILER